MPGFDPARFELFFGAIQQGQEVANGAVRFNGMPQRLIGPNLVVVLTANLFAFDNTASFEIGNDSLDRAFGNPDLLRDFAEHQ
jgi:hypothetical protein